MYSPINTQSKQLLLDDDQNISENHINEEISGKKVTQDDSNLLTKKIKNFFKSNVDEEEKSSTTVSEISSVMESDSSIEESAMTHEQMKEERNKKITKVFLLLFCTMAVARTD